MKATSGASVTLRLRRTSELKEAKKYGQMFQSGGHYERENNKRSLGYNKALKNKVGEGSKEIGKDPPNSGGRYEK